MYIIYLKIFINGYICKFGIQQDYKYYSAQFNIKIEFYFIMQFVK